MIKKLTDQEHILKRTGMYLGSTKPIKQVLHIIENEKLIKKEVEYIPALNHLFNEIIDNSIDESIRNNFKKANKIKIKIEKNYFIIEDNGNGIPIKKSEDEYLPKVAWGYARAGSNFDDSNRNTIGMNGIGSFGVNVLSKKFIGESFDGKLHYKGIWEDNASKYKEFINKSLKNGVKVTVYPDFERFGKKEFNEIDIQLFLTKVYMLSMIYPEIIFNFNENKIKGIKIEDLF